jgi:hypothetical protein
MTRSRSGAVENSSAEIAAKTGPLTDGEVMREVQQPREHAGVFRAMTWVIVLRSDAFRSRR